MIRTLFVTLVSFQSVACNMKPNYGQFRVPPPEFATHLSETADRSTPFLYAETGHPVAIQKVAFSPDSVMVATVGADWTLRIWNCATEVDVCAFGFATVPLLICFDKTGDNLIVTCMDGSVTLLNWRAGSRILVEKPGHTAPIVALAVSADGSRAATVDDDGTVAVRTLQNWKLERRWTRVGRHTYRLTFNPDGTSLALVSITGVLSVISVSDGAVRSFRTTGSTPWAGVAWPAANDLYTVRSNGAIELRDQKLGVRRVIKLADVKQVIDAVFDFAGRRVIASESDGDDVVVNCWSLESGARIAAPFAGSRGLFVNLDPHASRFAIAGAAREVTLWPLNVGAKRSVLRSHALQTLDLDLNRDKTMAYIATSAGMRACDLLSGRHQLLAADGALGDTEVRSVRMLPTERHLLTSWSDGAARVQDLTGAVQHTYQRRKPGTLLDGIARMVRSAVHVEKDEDPYIHSKYDSGKEIEITPLICAGASLDATVIATISEASRPRIWEAKTEREIGPLDPKKYRVRSLAINDDGSAVVTGGEDGKARVWDTQSHSRKKILPVGAAVAAVAFGTSPGQIITGDVSGRVIEWDSRSGRMRRKFTASPLPITAISLDKDRNRMATCGVDGAVRVWDLSNWQVLFTCRGHLGPVRRAVFTADGAHVVSVSTDDTVRFWRASDGMEVCRLHCLADNRWIVADAIGRFDAPDLEHVSGIHWLFPADNSSMLAPELFMRDYYEPGLLERALANDPLPKVRSVSSLNRAQPTVSILGVDRVAGSDRAKVMVEVVRGTYKSGAGVSWQTAAYDLRLFRDGQLVAQCPDAPQDSAAGDGIDQAELTNWRTASLVSPQTDPRVKQTSIDTVVVAFVIPLPHRAGQKLRFTAYTFNEDRVKGSVSSNDPAVTAR